MSGSLGHPKIDSRILIIDSWSLMEWLKELQPAIDIFESVLKLPAFSGAVLTCDPDFVKLRQGAAVEVEWLGA